MGESSSTITNNYSLESSDVSTATGINKVLSVGTTANGVLGSNSPISLNNSGTIIGNSSVNSSKSNITIEHSFTTNTSNPGVRMYNYGINNSLNEYGYR